MPEDDRQAWLGRLTWANALVVSDIQFKQEQQEAEAAHDPGRFQIAPGDEQGADNTAWGPPLHGVRCGFIQPDQHFTVGDKPTVRLRVGNISNRTIYRKIAVLEGLVPGIGEGGKNGSYVVMGRVSEATEFSEGARYATGKEVSEQFGIGHPNIKIDDPFPGYVRLEPGADVVLTLKMPVALDKPGRYQVEFAEVHRDNRVREPHELLSCPPVVVAVVEEGKDAPPKQDPTTWPEGEWGPAVNGMQARLNAKSIQNPGKAPSLSIDVRNFGEQKMRWVIAMENFEIEVDGVWYRSKVFRTGWVDVRPFGPGNRWQDVRWVPHEAFDWRDEEGNKLVFGEGGQRVRLAFHVDPQDGEFGNRQRLVTNTITLKPAEQEGEAEQEG